MKVTIDTETKHILISERYETALIENNVFMFNDAKTLLTQEQVNSIDSVISTINSLSQGIFGKKKVKKITYIEGVFTMMDNNNDIKIFFEKDLTVNDKTFTDQFKDICESWKPGFSTIYFVAPSTISADDVTKEFSALSENEQLIIGKVGEIMYNILNS